MPESTNDINSPKGWYSRGYLPHFDGGQIVQFITFRLADSLPVQVLNRYKFQLEQKLITEIEFHNKIDRYLDTGGGATFLKDANSQDRGRKSVTI